jgi:hypothetical protein
MSSIEFALGPQQSTGALPQMGFDGRPSVFADRYEPVSHLSRSIASTTPDVLSRTLGTLFQPIFPCDFVNFVVLDKSEGDLSWKSFGSEELARLDASPKDTTVWCVYEEEKPLCFRLAH